METQELIKWGLIIGTPLIVLILYKFILQLLFGEVIVPEKATGDANSVRLHLLQGQTG